MPGILKTYLCGLVEFGTAGIEQFGSVTSPYGEVAITGDIRGGTTVPVAADGQHVVWEYGVHGTDWAVVFMGFVGTGFLDLAIQVDTPVSDTDLSPSGTNTRWMHVGLTCKTPIVIGTRSVRLHASVGTWSGDSGGVPSLWSSGTELDGLIYKLMVRNRGTGVVQIQAFVAG